MKRSWFGLLVLGATVLPSAGAQTPGESRLPLRGLSPEQQHTARESTRERIRNAGRSDTARIVEEPGGNDQASDLVDELRYTKIQDIARARLTRAELEETPWSDDYWPIYAGMIARRYASSRLPSSNDWKTHYDYFVSTRNSTSLDELSPAEKYDLVIGDAQQTLSHAMWAEGQRYYRDSGKVETWMGLCHGWAGAAFMVPRPTHAVEVLAADGRTRLRFYPSDIKALATLLWANAAPESKFVGGRCNDQTPSTDRSGRPRSQDCRDTNPGTWHLAVVNQIGVSRRSFVMDATYNYEVWNQPVHAYSYSYFNPKSGNAARSLSQARVVAADWAEDPHRSHHSERTHFLVGVSMDVTYVVETSPTTATTDSPSNDQTNTVTYRYVLELAEDGEIVGGEWAQQDHPDFLWAPAPGSRAQSVGDRALSRSRNREGWNGTTAIPEAWATAAAQSSRSSQPLARVVEALVVLSRAQTR